MSSRPTRTTSGQLPKRFQNEEVTIPSIRQRTASGNSMPGSRPNSRSASVAPQAKEPTSSSPQPTLPNMPKVQANEKRPGRGRPRKNLLTAQPLQTPAPSPQITQKRLSSTARVQSLRIGSRTPQPKIRQLPHSVPKSTPKPIAHSPQSRNATPTPLRVTPVPSPTPSPPPRRSSPPPEELDDMTQVSDGCRFTMKDRKKDFVPPAHNDAWHQMCDGMKILLLNEFDELLGGFPNTAKFLFLTNEEQLNYQDIWLSEMHRDKEAEKMMRAANKQSSALFIAGFVHDLEQYNAIQDEMYAKIGKLKKPATHVITKDDIISGQIFVEQRTARGPKQLWMQKKLEEFVGVEVGDLIDRNWDTDDGEL